MDLTTKERVKLLRSIDASNTASDALIDQLIASVSARAEAFLGRTVTTGTYTESYETRPAGKVIQLRAYPVTSITSLSYAQLPSATDVTALVANDGYYLDASAGIVRLLVSPTPYKPGYLDVEYEGGMAADTDDFIAAWPAIAGAIDQQVIHEFNRRTSPGGEKTINGATTSYEGELSLLKGVREVLAMYAYVGGA